MTFTKKVKKGVLVNFENELIVDYATINSMSSFQGQNQFQKLKYCISVFYNEVTLISFDFHPVYQN
jgi:hypothetical protein